MKISGSYIFLVEEREFNNRAAVCEVSFELSRVFKNVFPGAQDKDEMSSTAHIPQAQIDTIAFIDDFTSPFPAIEVKYSDLTMNSLKYINDGLSKATFYIKRMEGKETPVVVEEFVVVSNQIVGLDQTQPLMRLVGTSTKNLLLQTRFHYAASGKKPVTEVLDGYLKAFADATTSKIEYKPFNPSSGGGGQAAQQGAGHTSRTIDGYITPANSTAAQNVEWLMLRSHCPDMGMYYLRYDLILRKLMLESLSLVFSSENISKTKSMNYFYLPTRTAGAVASGDGGKNEIPDRELVASSLKTYNNIGGQALYEMLSTVDTNTFDSLSRKWEKISMEDEKLSTFFPKAEGVTSAVNAAGGSASLTASPLEFEGVVGKLPEEVKKLAGTKGLFKTETTPNSELTVPARMDAVFKNFDMVEFKVGGNIARMSGDLLVLGSNDSTEEYFRRLAGVWLILRVVGNYVNVGNIGKFEQVVYAVRTTRLKIDQQSFRVEAAAVGRSGQS